MQHVKHVLPKADRSASTRFLLRKALEGEKDVNIMGVTKRVAWKNMLKNEEDCDIEW